MKYFIDECNNFGHNNILCNIFEEYDLNIFKDDLTRDKYIDDTLNKKISYSDLNIYRVGIESNSGIEQPI
jgi:hypothetical protein